MKLMRLKILRNFTLSLGIAALAFYAASAGANTERPTAIAADEGPTYAVEDLNYPDADKIWEEQGIKLIRGDGNIVLAECEARSDLIRIASRQQADTCFEVKGTGGYLTVEIPSVYGAYGNEFDTTLKTTVEGERATFDLESGKWISVGELKDPEQRPHTLVEIVSTK